MVTTASGTLSQSRYFGTADGKGKGTNPFELIAVAHSAGFSMTLAKELVRTVNGKSILGLMTLVAGQGTKLTGGTCRCAMSKVISHLGPRKAVAAVAC